MMRIYHEYDNKNAMHSNHGRGIVKRAKRSLGSRQRLPWPPAEGTTHFMLTPAPGSQPQSLRELADASLLVVEGTVQAVLPVRQVTQHLETDVVILISRVVKGPNISGGIAITQFGGVLGKYTEMPSSVFAHENGENTGSLFLTQDKRPSPEVPGIPRYWIVGQWVGDVRTDGASAVHFNHGAPDSLRQRYEGMNQTQFMLELLPLIPPK